MAKTDGNFTEKFKNTLEFVTQLDTDDKKPFIELCEELYKEIDDLSEFTINIQNIMDQIFVQDYYSHSIKSKHSEICLKFLALFSAETYRKNIETNCTLFEIIISSALERQNLENKNIRYFSCRFLNLLLSNIENNISLKNKIFINILNAMLIRTKDSALGVRLQAINALAYLQNSSNSECKVIKTYLKLLNDEKSVVRREVVQRIVINEHTSRELCRRCLDVNDCVRSHVYQRCITITPSNLTNEDRYLIIYQGFKEKNFDIQSMFLNTLLIIWLDFYENDFLKFLNAVTVYENSKDIVRSKDLCKSILNHFLESGIYSIERFFKPLSLNLNRFVPIEKLSKNLSLYWLLLYKYFDIYKTSRNIEFMKRLKPEGYAFFRYIDKFLEKEDDNLSSIDNETILRNLFSIGNRLNITSEYARKYISKMLMRLLSDRQFCDSMVKKILRVIYNISQDTDDFFVSVRYIITDINSVHEYTDEDIEDRIYRINEELMELENRRQHFFVHPTTHRTIPNIEKRMEKLEERLEILRKMKDNEYEEEILLWSLKVLHNSLSLKKVITYTSNMDDLLRSFLLPNLYISDEFIHYKIVECLSVYCVMNREAAIKYSKLVCLPVLNYNINKEQNKTAIRNSIYSICDILKRYGQTFLQTVVPPSSNYSFISQHLFMSYDFIIDLFNTLLEDECIEIRIYAISGFAKLLIWDMPIYSTTIKSIILQCHIDPQNEEEVLYHSRLAMTIEKFAEKPIAQKIFMDCLYSIFEIVAENKYVNKKYLAPYNQKAIMKFLAKILHSKNDGNYELMLKLYNDIDKNLNKNASLLISRFLIYIVDEPFNPFQLNELKIKYGTLITKTKDKTLIKNLNKFIKSLDTVADNKNIEISEDGDNIAEDDDDESDNSLVRMKKRFKAKNDIVLLENDNNENLPCSSNTTY